MTTSTQPTSLDSAFIDTLNTAAVRMLANAVFGPSLLGMLSTESDLESPLIAKAPCFERNDHQQAPIFLLTAENQQWLQQLDKQPDALLALLHSDKHLKLGIYHERLWQYFLTHNDKTQLIASNLKARNNGNDLGEFDLIYEHSDYGLVHLEIASKYYLACSQETEQWQTWLGPGKTDRLDLKLKHSINKQMNLADHPSASEQLLAQLDSRGVARPTPQQPLNKQLHIGGRLFYRREEAVDENLLSSALTKASRSPEKLNTQHQSAHWLLLSEWQTLLEKYQVDYHLVDKPYWLDTASGNQRRLANMSVDNEIATRMPEMVIYAIKELNIDTEFCFIVPNNWLTM
jgi:hypothetical protein